MLDSLQRYFANRINQKGPSHEAVDWGSADRQHLAFRQVLKILEDPVTGQLARRFSLLDYGLATVCSCPISANTASTSLLTQATI